MADNDLYRFLARLTAKEYAKLRKFLLSDGGSQNEKPGDGETNVTSGQDDDAPPQTPKNKKPRA